MTWCERLTAWWRQCQRLQDGDITPEMFGAVAGGPDASAAIQAAIIMGAATGRRVAILGAGAVYAVSVPLVIPSAPFHLFSDGAILRNTTNASPGANRGMIEADFSTGPRQYDLVIEGLVLEGATEAIPTYAGFRRGIIVRNATRVTVRRNIISRIDLPTTGIPADVYGIWLHGPSETTGVTEAEVVGNHVTFVERENTATNFAIGILLESYMIDGENGQVTGAMPAAHSVTHINVRHNTVRGGTHGINPKNTADVRIIGNHMEGQGSRNIILYATNHRIIIANNVFRRAGSTNLVADYGNHGVVITGNLFDGTVLNSSSGAAEGCNVNLYYGNNYVLVSGNVMREAKQAGVQVAYGGDCISIVDNDIVDAGTQGVLISSTLPSNYTAVLATGGALTNIAVTSNRIRGAGVDGVCVIGIYPTTILATSDLSVIVANNEITDVTGYSIRLWQNGYASGTWSVAVRDNTTVGASIAEMEADYTYPV